ncbi:esterase/lipase family protein [Mycobacteroides chelonae]|uniref:esterase/lipase family protein n=1 Tax=Mycobacteroides chelonae TaxID=1774 RepID=UPI000D6A4271|nr:hypothetical protein [Mycobacteroides chelonae]
MYDNDLIIVIPGITGSTLHHGQEVIWSCRPRDVLKSLARLHLNMAKLKLPDDIGDNAADDGIRAGALMPRLHGIPGLSPPFRGYEPLVQRLRAARELPERSSQDHATVTNPVAFPYDWRLSNRYTARQLKLFAESALDQWRSSSPRNRDALITFVCHSMGGLVARWYVSMEGGAAVTRKVITLGTPYRGTVRALEVLTKGPAERLGGFGRLLHQATVTFPSVYQLLPSYACVDDGSQLGQLNRQHGLALPTAKLVDSVNFYRDIEAREEVDAGTSGRRHVIVGVGQRTLASASLRSGTLEYSHLLDGHEHGGDGTVSAVSIPKGIALDDNTIRRVTDTHGNLQCNAAALDEIESVISSKPILIKASQSVGLAVSVPELVGTEERFTVTISSIPRRTVVCTLCDESEQIRLRFTVVVRDGEQTCVLGPLAPGGYTLEFCDPTRPHSRVLCPLIVWPTAA